MAMRTRRRSNRTDSAQRQMRPTDSYFDIWSIVCDATSVCVCVSRFQFIRCINTAHTAHTHRKPMRKRDLPNGSHRNDRTWCNSEDIDFNQKNRFIFTAYCRRSSQLRIKTEIEEEEKRTKFSAVIVVPLSIAAEVFVRLVLAVNTGIFAHSLLNQRTTNDYCAFRTTSWETTKIQNK